MYILKHMKSFLPNFQLCSLCVHRDTCTWTNFKGLWEKYQVDNTIFKLNKVHQYNIFSTSHNRCTFLPLHALTRKPIYKVCFKILSTVDRHNFVSRSHNSFTFWCFPYIKSMSHEYWQRECLPVCLRNVHNYAPKELSWAFSGSVLWLHLNLNDI